MFTVIRSKLDQLLADEGFSEILSGSFYALFARVLATLLATVTTILVARHYGAEALGILAIINSYLVVVTVATTFGMPASVLRLVPQYIAIHSFSSAFVVHRKIQLLVAVFSISATIVILPFSESLASIVFSSPALATYLMLATGCVIFRSFVLTTTPAFRAIRRVDLYSLMLVLPALTMMIFLLSGAVLFDSPGLPVYAHLTSTIATSVLGVVILEHAFRKRVGSDEALKTPGLPEIMTVSFPMFVTTSMQVVMTQTGVIVLGMFRSEAEVGYFSAASRLALLTTFILAAINSMAAPKFSELHSLGRIDELFRVARRSTKLIFWTTIPVLAVLILLGSPILKVFFGEDFSAAFLPMLILVAGQFVHSVSGSTTNFMNMTGNQQTFRNIIAAAAAMNVLLAIILVPYLGIIGAALAGAFSLSFLNLYTLAFIKRRFGQSIGYLPFV